MPILTRDQRYLIKIQRDNAQIRYTLRDQVDLTPQKKKTGRRPKLSDTALDQIITFIQSSIERRILTCEQICRLQQLPVSAETLRTSLKKRGMTAHPAA
ncbi:hypothetical protein N7528_002421 [Penicillium herquei]|nr:hypothetical protein N7528_002421 [Penicillium herquei]